MPTLLSEEVLREKRQEATLEQGSEQLLAREPDDAAATSDTSDLAGETQPGEGAPPDPNQQTLELPTDDDSSVLPADAPDADAPDADAPDAGETWQAATESPGEAPLGDRVSEDPPGSGEGGFKRGTVTFESERTVDFRPTGDDEADFSLLSSQWQTAAGPAGADSGATIRQKETVGGSFMTSSSLVVKSRQVRSAEESPTFIKSPDDAPDYELLSVIGEGGMGVVYAARQSSIARTVAVKMLKGSDSGTAEQREKFISEAVVTGELDHPNIVPIYDLGANDQGALFYSMKRVKGTPWNDVIKAKSLDENLNILLRVCDAVAFAHVNGVIHRDLKPENVMLGDYGEVLVMDWGLARISAEFPNVDSVSQSSAMGGTPAYMAPEMATGPIERISAASDVYLLGAILHEIVTGRPPHRGESVMGCLFAASKNKIIESGCSGELYDIALHAMETEIEKRYRSVKEFQDAIREYQAHSESIVLTNHAATNLTAAAKQQGYDLFARSVYGLEEALALWHANRRAESLLTEARLAYASRALEQGDIDLGKSLLDPQVDEHRPLLAKLDQAHRERASRKRLLGLLKGAVAALVVAVVGVVSFAYLAVSRERDEAVFQRDRAVKAEGEALANAQEANQQRAKAVENEAIAQQNAETARRQEQEALRQKKIAEEATEVAIQQREEAVRQKGIADQAKQAEEYAAYVARIGLTRAKIEENAFDSAGELLAQCAPELRHWEWGRLRQLCQLSLYEWPFDAPVTAVAFDPDGKHFATGDWTGTTSIWDLATRQPIHTFQHGQYVHAVAYHPLLPQLAAAGSDHAIRIYDTRSGELLKTLTGHDDAVLGVSFSPDGKWLLSCGYDDTARLWELASGELLQTLRLHSWWVWSAEFSADASRLVTAGQDGKAIVWERSGTTDPPRYTPLTEFTVHRGPVYAARFAPSGEVVTGGYDGRVLVWNPDEVRPIDLERRLDGQPDPPAPYRELVGHNGPVRTAVFSADGRTLATGGQDNLLIVWDLDTGTARRVLRGHASHVRSCTFSPDGTVLLSAGRDQRVLLWRPEQYAEQFALEATTGKAADAVLTARFSADGRRIVTAGRDRIATLWDAQTRLALQTFSEGHEFLASAAEFFRGGQRLATGAGDGTVRIWDAATGAEVLKLAGTGRSAALDVADDGRWVATGSTGNQVLLFNAQDGALVGRLDGHQAHITAVRFAPDGRWLATGDERGVARLWRRAGEAFEWEFWKELTGHSRAITALAFADEGRRLVSSSGDNSCGQWDVQTGEELTGLVLKHPDWVADMVVSRDGRQALTCCDDGKLRLWLLETATLQQTLVADDRAPHPLTSVDLSADGRYAAAASAAEGTVRIWDLANGRELSGGDSPTANAAWLDLSGGRGQIWVARFGLDARSVLTIGGNDAQLRNLANADVQVRFSPHGTIASADISPDGSRMATGSWDRSVKVWDVTTAKVVAKLDGVHRDNINSVVFSPSGDQLLTASDDHTARLWDLAGKPLQPVLQGHQGSVRSACFSPGGDRILTVSSDKTARVWDARTGEVLQILAGHHWALLSGVFDETGSRVITGSEDNTAIVWDLATGQPLARLAGHTGAVTSVALSRDGRRALTGSDDNLVKIWDATQGKEILTLNGHTQAVTSVSFSPDGLQALTSGRDGQTLIWPALDWREPLAQQASASGAGDGPGPPLLTVK
jgi:WD40 repeat protein